MESYSMTCDAFERHGLAIATSIKCNLNLMATFQSMKQVFNDVEKRTEILETVVPKLLDRKW